LLLDNPYLLKHFGNREVETSKENSSSSYLSALSAAPFGRSLCSPANICTIALINKTNKQMVYFRKVNINKGTNTATLICTDTPIEKKQATIAGIPVATRNQTNVTFGVLSLNDPKTGQTMNADHATIKELQKTLNVGDAMPGFRLSTNAVMDMNTKEPTTLMWVEAE